MTEQLQDLLNRIQEDSVRNAEAKSKEILAAAEEKARAITEKARADAESSRRKAELDAKTLLARSEKALEQTARDVILSVGSAVSKILDRIVTAKVDAALSPDLLKELLSTAIRSYFDGAKNGVNLQVTLNPKDEAALKSFFMSELKSAASKGLEIRGDNGVIKGFKLSMVNGTSYHDFTRDAIAESLCQLLRPHLADIVRRAVAEGK